MFSFHFEPTKPQIYVSVVWELLIDEARVSCVIMGCVSKIIAFLKYKMETK